jgi:hypothetical protein
MAQNFRIIVSADLISATKALIFPVICLSLYIVGIFIKGGELTDFFRMAERGPASAFREYGIFAICSIWILFFYYPAMFAILTGKYVLYESGDVYKLEKVIGSVIIEKDRIKNIEKKRVFILSFYIIEFESGEYFHIPSTFCHIVDNMDR